MYGYSSGRQIVAMLLAAILMTFVAAAMAVSAIGVPVIEAIARLALAAGTFILANYSFQAAVSLREADREALRQKLIPVRLRVRDRR